jgi:hypothetical protein
MLTLKLTWLNLKYLMLRIKKEVNLIKVLGKHISFSSAASYNNLIANS